MMEGLKELHDLGISIFITKCEFHSITLFEEEFLENEVMGLTPAKAVSRWATQDEILFIEGGDQTCSEPSSVFAKHRNIFRTGGPPKLI